MATYKLVDEEKLDAAMTATADAIRAKTGSTNPIAWDAEKGMSEAVEPVFEAGKKSEYDAFWDALQKKGNRTEYQYAFARVWSDDMFWPKYDFNITGSGFNGMFNNSGITNLKEKLVELGLSLNTSDATQFLQVFQASKVKHVPELDLRKATNASYTFGTYAEVEIIDKLIVSETTPFSNTFHTAGNLSAITFEGTIGAAIDLHWSPLSKASILSTITALSDSTSGLTASFSLTAVNTSFETSPGAADGSTSEEWTALIATKPNWTISLA